MAHEIMEHDHLVLAGAEAWHGLGTVVENAPTPADALRFARLDWTVEQWPLVAQGPDGLTSVVKNNVVNVRSDTKGQLGIVGKNWVPYQNNELAQFCTDLAQAGDVVKVESAGSIKNGQKVWFLLRGESFSVRREDEVKPYILVSNGFDGNTAFRATPTTVRVVCSNTLHMVIPQREGNGYRKVREAGYVLSHTKSLRDRIEECRKVLGLYEKTLTTQREMIDHLAAREVDNEAVKRFLLECFTKDFGAVADNPANEGEQKHRDKALEAVASAMMRFDAELYLAGGTAWNAFNAYTGWLQNDRPSNRRDAEAAHDAKVSSTLFSTNANRTVSAFELALSL